MSFVNLFIISKPGNLFRRNHGKIIIVLLMLLNVCYAKGRPGSAVALKCEHLVSPLGIDEAQPRLSWQINDTRQGALQSAYTVFVSTDSVQLVSGKNLVWNSGKVKSSAILITYHGTGLKPCTRYYWKVRVWDPNGTVMTDSKIAFFETGVMGINNWTGSWISDGGSINMLKAPYFRKTFHAAKKIRSARAYIAVAGLYELFINGKKIGNHRLDPMYTRFDR